MKFMEHAELLAGITVISKAGDVFKQIEESGTITALNIYEMEDMFNDRILFAPARMFEDSLELVKIQTEITFAYRDSKEQQFTFYRVNRELMNYRDFTFGQDQNTCTPIRDHVMDTVLERMAKQDPAVAFNGHSFPLTGEQLNRLVDVVPCGVSLTTLVNKAYVERVVTIHVLVRLYQDSHYLLNLDDQESVVLTDQGLLVRPALDEGVWECSIEPARSRLFWTHLQKESPFNIAMLVPCVE